MDINSTEKLIIIESLTLTLKTNTLLLLSPETPPATLLKLKYESERILKLIEKIKE